DMDASPPGFTAMITMSRADEKISGQNESDVAATFDLLSSGHSLNKNAPITGPAIDAMPAMTEFASQAVEKYTGAYSVRTEPSWYEIIVPASAAIAPATAKPVSFTRTGLMP